MKAPGRLASITYASSGWLIGYARDAAGQITSVTSTQPGHSATNLVSAVTHMPFGPVKSFTYGNGVTDTRTYRPRLPHDEHHGSRHRAISST